MKRGKLQSLGFKLANETPQEGNGVDLPKLCLMLVIWICKQRL